MPRAKPQRLEAKRKKKPTVPKAKLKVVLRPEPLFRKKEHFDERMALESLRRDVFEADAARWEKGERTQEGLVAAFGYWIGYPAFLEMIGRNWREDDVRMAAYHALNAAHNQATRVLMEAAERNSLAPHPLYECGRVVQEIYLADPDLCFRRAGALCDTWPECMGAVRYSLPAGQQEALRAGEAVFIRLAVKAGIADREDLANVAAKVDPRNRPEVLEAITNTEGEYSNPMSLVEMANRLGNMDYRAFKKLASATYGLQRVTQKLWRVRLDMMDAATRRKIETGR